MEDKLLFYGAKVMCSSDKNYKEFWYGTYIASHPVKKDLHIVLLRARPNLKIKESLDIFKYCKIKNW